jgi:hypoxanthine phosphoribosyltransferase
MPDYMFIEYDLFGRILEGLVAQLKRLKKMSGVYDFTHVYAPPRGGWPIAVHLSHHLNLQLIEVIDLNYPPDYFGVNDNLLVVDDVVDTGRTFNDLKEMLDNIIEDLPTFQYKLASIHYKPRTIIKPEIFMQEVPNDTWIVYPWESKENCGEDCLEFQERRFIEQKVDRK